MIHQVTVTATPGSIKYLVSAEGHEVCPILAGMSGEMRGGEHDWEMIPEIGSTERMNAKKVRSAG